MLLIVHIVIAVVAVAALALRPKSNLATAVVAAAALSDVALGAAPGPVVSVIAPLIAFLGAALTLAGFVQRSGLAERAAGVLAACARGSSLLLYVLVCALCVALTAAISLDGAVVLMVPLLLVLARRFGAPFAPLFLGTVVVANAASIAVPQGNPTNLVIISRLGLSATAFIEHMLAPGLAAAAICAAGVALWERRALATPLRKFTRPSSPLSRDEWHSAISLAFAALVAFAAPLAGIAPWWPFAGAVALALVARRERPRLIVPWRVSGPGRRPADRHHRARPHPPRIRGRQPAGAAGRRRRAWRGRRARQQPADQRLRDRPADGRRAGLRRLGRAGDRLAGDSAGVGRDADRKPARGPVRAAGPGPQVRAAGGRRRAHGDAAAAGHAVMEKRAPRVPFSPTQDSWM